MSELLNIKLQIEYDGKNYCGWQRQKNKPSIQETIENSISKLIKGEKINLTGAGRTDTGVHAYCQTANFIIESDKFSYSGIKKFVFSLNGILPDDISILSGEFVQINFHSRYHAKERIYKYFFTLRKDALNRERVFYYKNNFDSKKAVEFCELLTGTHSFKTLCKNRADKHDFMSVVNYAKIKKRKDGIFEFEINAVRFLHSMVRAIVGAMLKISSGQIDLQDFKIKFLKEERINIQYVPPHALYLHKIIY